MVWWPMPRRWSDRTHRAYSNRRYWQRQTDGRDGIRLRVHGLDIEDIVSGGAIEGIGMEQLAGEGGLRVRRVDQPGHERPAIIRSVDSIVA